MKKLKHILPLMAVLFVVTACDDEDYRDPSAIADEYIQEHWQLLTSSELGWRFDYSPDEDKYGVFTFLMDFQENGRVRMQTDRDFFYLSATGSDLQKAYKPQESDYTIQNSEGPVLTFATYNLLTKLADPELNVQGSGWGGDNDFIIMGHSANNDTIYLRSLKGQKPCFLVRNTEDWNTYFDKVNAVIDNFSGAAVDNTYFRDIVIEGCEPAVMTEFSMTTRMGVVYQKVGDNMVADTCRLRFTSEAVYLDKPLLIGENTQVTHFMSSDQPYEFLVNGQAGSIIKVAEEGRPKMVFDVRDKVFKGVFEEVMDGVTIERDDMYQIDIHPEESNDEWTALSAKIQNYLYMLLLPGNDKDYYVALYAQLTDEKGQMHPVLAQCKINYSWSGAEDEVRFRSLDTRYLLFAGMDTEDGEWALDTPLAQQFENDLKAEFLAYMYSIFGESTSNRNAVSCIVVPSVDGTSFSFVNKKTGGFLRIMKAY